MTKKILIFAGVYAAFLLQSVIFDNFRFFSAAPNILIAFLIIVSVGSTPGFAAAYGAFGGMITDVLCGRIFGISILAYMYLSYAVSATVDSGSVNSPLIMGWIGFVYTALFQIIYSFSYSVMNPAIPFSVSSVFVKSIFSAFAAIIWVYLNNLKNRKKNPVKEDGESS